MYEKVRKGMEKNVTMKNGPGCGRVGEEKLKKLKIGAREKTRESRERWTRMEALNRGLFWDDTEGDGQYKKCKIEFYCSL